MSTAKRSGKDGRAGVAPFVAKLYELVQDPTTDSVIHWFVPVDSVGTSASSGEAGDEVPTCFVVDGFEQFAARLLPRISNSTSFCSFVRQLNGYGFSKAHPKRAAFAHPHFRKGDVASLALIKRRPTAKRRADRSSILLEDTESSWRDRDSHEPRRQRVVVRRTGTGEAHSHARSAREAAPAAAPASAPVAATAPAVPDPFMRALVADSLDTLKAIVLAAQSAGAPPATGRFADVVQRTVQEFARRQLPMLFEGATAPVSLVGALDHLKSVAEFYAASPASSRLAVAEAAASASAAISTAPAAPASPATDEDGDLDLDLDLDLQELDETLGGDMQFLGLSEEPGSGGSASRIADDDLSAGDSLAAS